MAKRNMKSDEFVLTNKELQAFKMAAEKEFGRVADIEKILFKLEKKEQVAVVKEMYFKLFLKYSNISMWMSEVLFSLEEEWGCDDGEEEG